MKNIILLMAIFSTSLSYSQSQNWWKSDGTNTGSASTFVGTSNNFALRFKANGTEWFSISPTGAYKFNSLNSTTKGILGVDQNGILFRTDFTGSSSDVLTGTGDFVNMGTLSGWTLNGNTLFSNYNIGIGTNIAPEKLTVNGNLLANGSISGTSLNVIDIVTSGKEFKISTSLCMKGIDANTPGSRNEICGLNGDLYIQSELNNNYNTVFGYNNGSKVGFGIIPIEKFHVGVDAKFDGNIFTNKIYTNRITSNDSVIAFGDSSVYVNTIYNQIYGSSNTYMKGIALGPATYPKGVNSVAIGRRVRADGINSMVIGRTDVSSSSMLINTIDNSLMVGFNSDIPTLFVSPATGGNGTTGAVGIGTTVIPGDYKLAVKGKIIAEEVYVKLYSNGWPDYVFDADYKKMSILEKESYIKENKHLPGIVSAQKIVETGIPTGEVMKGITQNLEENSLEIIELYKMFEELKKENEELKRKVEELENK